MSILKGEGTHTILYGTADIHNGLRSNRGYLARPDHAGAYSTLLISHDWAGITSSLKALARTLARNGFAVLIPDFYRGQGSGAAWPADRLVADLEDARRFVSSSDTPWAGEVVVLGIGSGAPAAIEFVRDHQETRALILVSPLTTFGLEDVNVPTLGMYGKADELAEDWDDAQRRAPLVEWILYGAAGHDFLDESSENFDAAVAEDAIDRILGFLKAHAGANASGLTVGR